MARFAANGWGRLARLLRLDRPTQKPIENGFRLAARYWPWVLIGLWALCFLPFFTERPLRFEEGRRAAQALGIYYGGDWWRLNIGGVPYLAKPPMLPWIMTGFAYLRGGVDEAAVRLGPVLGVLALAMSAAFTARGLAPRSDARMAALLAGLAILGSVFTLQKARLGETDLLTSLFAGCAMGLWILMRLRGDIRFAGWAAIGVFLALVNFTKGPIPLFFPLIPIVFTAVYARRTSDIAGVAFATAIAFVPLGIWLLVNSSDADAGYIADEMRLTQSFTQDYLLSLLHLGLVPSVLFRVMPWVLPVVVWLFVHKPIEDPRKREIVRALVIYVVPYAIVILLWPGGKERYVMPIAWPIAVLAGVALAEFWPRNRMAATVACIGLVAMFSYQAVVALTIDGRTDFQIERRALVSALGDATRGVDGRILIAVPSGEYPDYNIYSYAAGSILRIAEDAVACPPDGGKLVAEGSRIIESARTAPVWEKAVLLPGGRQAVFSRTDAPPDPADCGAAGRSAALP